MDNFAKQVKSIRLRRGFTMQDLSDKADVSKSMISKIESGAVQPTLDVAGRLAAAFNVSLSEMLHSHKVSRVVVLTQKEQAVWKDAQHILRRNLSPVFEGLKIEWLKVTLPPGTAINALPPSTTYPVEKFLLVNKGRLVVKIGEEEFTLSEGESLYFEADREHSLINTSKGIVEYYIILKHNH